jgi:hypothetical protein
MNAAIHIGWCRSAAVVLLLAAPPAASLAAQPPASDKARFATALSFPVTDTTRMFEYPLDSLLVIRVFRQVDAESRHMGWWVAVMRTPTDRGGFNLLYHSRSWHGPYPTDLYAWHWAKTRFPNERILPVHGYPYEVRVRCHGCETGGEEQGAHFTEGVVEVGWRRLPRPNPDPA